VSVCSVVVAPVALLIWSATVGLGFLLSARILGSASTPIPSLVFAFWGDF
jgi:hypothetical protein